MNLLTEATFLPTQDLRDPAHDGALDARGRLQVLPHAFWQQYTQTEIAVFCHKQAIYCIPTLELVTWLKALIADRKTIEIGAGAGVGVIGEALNIPATDNRMQEWPDIAAHYQAIRQPAITYGDNVIRLDAELALARYRPAVVLAAWVTHKWKPSEAWREGNQHGVDERKLIRQADYVFIGHDHVHRNKPILDLPHERRITARGWFRGQRRQDGTTSKSGGASANHQPPAALAR